MVWFPVGAALLATAATATASSQLCRSTPADASWPSEAAWSRLNSTVGGKLIKTVPIAAVCHDPLYDEAQCATLRETWHSPSTHLLDPASPMAFEHSGAACNPFAPRDQPCEVGNLVVYTVNATEVAHLRETVRFASEWNVRLVIRNSGHDYLGKSTGKHGLGLWTRYLQDLEHLAEFEAKNGYRGPAVKVGAGVLGGDAQAFAHGHGLTVVTGNCPSVAIAGGFTQGGGHSPLATRYGLGADQVLEWEVVNAEGELLVASPKENADLFWALAGGGGGTYGVVVSMTVKAYANEITSKATMTMALPEEHPERYWEVVGTFLERLPSMVDAGLMVIWVMLPNMFMIFPAMAIGVEKDKLNDVLLPVSQKATDLKVDHQFEVVQHDDYLTAYKAMPEMWNVADFQVAGRLIPRSLVETSPAAVLEIVKHVSSRAFMSGVTFDVAQHEPKAGSAVNPQMREALFSLAAGSTLDYNQTERWAEEARILDREVLQIARDVVPEAGAYLNEASGLEQNWQQQFYGNKYSELLAVKTKYDPDGIFFARTAVGSEAWVEQTDGRLCRVSSSNTRNDHSEL
jgi:FAD/FMN-containing dehydrogenase